MARRCSAKAWSSDDAAWCRAPPRPGRVGRADLVPAHGVSTRIQRRFRDRVTIALESHVARLQASVVDHRAPGAPGLPRPAVGAPRPGLRARPHVHVGVLHLRAGSCGSRSPSAAGLHPPGAGAARPLRAADGVTSAWRPAVERASRRRGAGTTAWPATCSGRRRPPRPARRCASPASASGSPERRAGVGALVRDRSRARWVARGLAHAGLGDVRRSGTSARSCSSRGARTPPRATCCWCSRPAPGCRRYIGATVGEIGFLRGIWLDGVAAPGVARGLRRSARRAGRLPAPERLTTGIRLRTRLVRLPGHRPARARGRHRSICRRARWWRSWARTAPARSRWSSCWPAVQAHVRADPRRRRRLARMPVEQWRARLAGAFQDFFRFEFARAADRGRRRPAAPRRRRRSRRGRPGRRRRRGRALAAGLERSSARPGRAASTSSFGQWQKLALARGFMRDGRCCWCWTSPPPRSTPRPSTRCSSATPRRRATRRRTTGPHHGAGLAPLLDGAHGRPDRRARRRAVVEVGGHEELMAHGGQYAELYGIQAAAYR